MEIYEFISKIFRIFNVKKKKKKECKLRLYKNIVRKIILFKEMVYVDFFNLSLEIFLVV